MNGSIPNQLLMRLLQATPQQQEVIAQILNGKTDLKTAAPTGPLLLGMGAGAKFLGVSRATLWRMVKLGKLEKVELLPGSFRIRRADLESIGRRRQTI